MHLWLGFRPMASSRIYIVRHGETDENRTGIFQGQLDTPLNEDGIEQARRVAEALRHISFDIAFTSDLILAVKVMLRFQYLNCLQLMDPRTDCRDDCCIPSQSPTSKGGSLERKSES